MAKDFSIQIENNHNIFRLKPKNVMSSVFKVTEKQIEDFIAYARVKNAGVQRL